MLRSFLILSLITLLFLGSAVSRAELVNNSSARPVATGRGLIDSFTWTPDSQRIVLALNKSGIPGGPNNLFQLELASGQLTSLTRTQEEDTLPMLSPDGRHLAFLRGPYSEANIWVLSLANRRARQLTYFPRQRRASATTQIYRAFGWNADGKSLILTETSYSTSPRLYTIDLSTGARRRLTTLEKNLATVNGLLPTIEGLAVAPTGDRWAIFSVGEGHPQITIAHLKEVGASVVVDPYPGTLSQPRWSRDGRYVYVSADVDLIIDRERRNSTARGRPGTFRIEASTGEVERVSNRYGELSPDGQKLVWQEFNRQDQSSFQLWLEELPAVAPVLPVAVN